MTQLRTSVHRYPVGGSLDANNPFYVRRPADDLLYELLQAGELCYVFNCRQMGKSSAASLAMQRLKEVGICCIRLDLSRIGKTDDSSEKWCRSIIDALHRGVKTRFEMGTLTGLANLDIEGWHQQYQSLMEEKEISAVRLMSRYFEEILLPSLPEQKYVIFIDEIDYVLNLSFDGSTLFSLIRAFSNLRADDDRFNRLTFALLGVATPAQLTQDMGGKTPFNIGRDVMLTGFEFERSLNLAEGLVGFAPDPEAILREILNWTGGQPFLTLKILDLIQRRDALEHLDKQIPELVVGLEKTWVDLLVRSHIIEKWKGKDDPEHLQHIENYILNEKEQSAGSLLGLYLQLLEKGEIDADSHPDQLDLRLSGLAVLQAGKLRIYNRIYREVFNRDWVKSKLDDMRLFSDRLNLWLTTRDPQHLLKGKDLEGVLEWSQSRRLDPSYYRFITASQDKVLHLSQDNLMNVEQKLGNTERLEAEAQRRLKTTQKRLWWSGLALMGVIGGAIAVFVAILTQVKQANLSLGLADVRLKSTAAKEQLLLEQPFTALIGSLRAAQQLKQLDKSVWARDYTLIQVAGTLLQVVYSVHEYNSLAQDPVSSFAISPDGQTIVSGSGDGTVKLWNREGRELLSIEGHQDEVRSVAISPDGQTIVSGSQDGTAKLWSRDGHELLTFNGHQASVTSVVFSSDGQTIVSGSGDGTVKLWNREGRELLTLDGHKRVITSVAISPDGQTIVAGSWDHTVKLWSRDGRELMPLKGHQYVVSSVAFSPDGQTIVSGSWDHTVKLWSREGRELLTLKGHKYLVNSVAFSPDGQTVVSGSTDRSVKLWSRDRSSILDGRELLTLSHQAPVHSVAFSPDGQTIVSAGGSKGGTVKLWSRDGRELPTLKGHQDWVTSVAISSDGQTIASGSEDGIVKLWSRDGRELLTLNRVGNGTISPDGQTIAGSGDRTVKLWSRDGRELLTLNGHQSSVTSVATSSDGQTIVSGSMDRSVRLWSRDGRELLTLNRHRDVVDSVAISLDGQTIVSGSRDGTVKLWSRDGRELVPIRHRDGGTSVAISPDGQTIASGSEDGTVKLWSRDGRELLILNGHQSSVTSVAISPDGQTIVSGSKDTTVKLWSRDGRELLTLKGDKAVFSVAISSDRQTIVSGSADG
jgi:WD40 repeat protein